MNKYLIISGNKKIKIFTSPKIFLGVILICLIVIGLIILFYNFEKIEVALITRKVTTDGLNFDASVWSKRALEKAASHLIEQHKQTNYFLTLSRNNVSLINLKMNCWNALLDIAQYVNDDSRNLIEEYCNVMLLNKKLDKAEVRNYKQYILSRLVNCTDKDTDKGIEYYRTILSDIDKVQNVPATNMSVP
jgi:hypothetical protein